MLKGAYRFFENGDIEPDDIVQSHIEATYHRLDQVSLANLTVSFRYRRVTAGG
jgi:hypothetical protein